MAKQRVLLALVGEQPMPIIIPVFQRPPDKLVLLCTPQTARMVGRIRRALSLADATREVQVAKHQTAFSPYDPEQVEKECLAAIEDCGDCEISINITGGTKVMSAAAVLCAHSIGAEAVYVVTDGAGTLVKWRKDSVTHEPVDVRIPIDVRFASHGLQAVPGNPWEESYIEASRLLADLTSTHPHQRLTQSVARTRIACDTREVCLWRPSAAEKTAAWRLADMGFWHATLGSDSALRIGLFDDPVCRDFVCGKWLEAYAYQACSGSGAPFDQCWPNVVISSKDGLVVNELDMVVCKNEEMAVCSCKTGGRVAKDEAREAIYELDSVAGAMRAGRYCRKVLISSRFGLPDSAFGRARESGITVITGQDLPRLADMIAKAMT